MVAKRRFSILLLVCLMVLNSSINVFASEETDSDGVSEFITEFMLQCEQLGIEPSVAESLLDKLRNGETWDCFLEEYADIEPVEIRRIDNETIERRFVYPDGSVRVSTLRIFEKNDLNQNGVNQINVDQSDGIQPCDVDTGSGHWESGSGYSAWYGAYVEERYMANSLVGFYADLEFYQTPVNQVRVEGSNRFTIASICGIYRVYDPYINVLGEVQNDPEPVIIHKYGNETYPAEAEMEVIVNFPLLVGQTNLRLKLYAESYSSIWSELHEAEY